MHPKGSDRAGRSCRDLCASPSHHRPPRPGRRPTRRPSIQGFRSSRKVRSAPRTSSTRMPRTPISGRRRTARAPAPPPTRTAATRSRCRSGRRWTSPGQITRSVLAYNSWLTMQSRGETDENTCAFNDLALIRLDPADVAKVNPSVPQLGGPIGGRLGRLGLDRLQLRQLRAARRRHHAQPEAGSGRQNTGGGWSHDVYTATPGIPGDSGSGFLNASGGAIGVLSTVQLAPLAGSNGVGDFPSEIAYMHANAPGFAGSTWCREPSRSTGMSPRPSSRNRPLGIAATSIVGWRGRVPEGPASSFPQPEANSSSASSSWESAARPRRGSARGARRMGCRGIGRMTGECARSQASATCAGVASCRDAIRSTGPPGWARWPDSIGAHGKKAIPSSSQRSSTSCEERSMS